MNKKKSTNRDLYFTKNHEWIDFQGTVAYMGICNSRLSGFKEIHQIQFNEPTGLKKKGEIIATITYNDYQIDALMPVDGRIIKINEALLTGNQNSLLQDAETSGWLALIGPTQPYERKDLLLQKQYQLNGKGKHAK